MKKTLLITALATAFAAPLCAQASYYVLSGPATAAAGSNFNVYTVVMDAGGNMDPTYTGTMNFGTNAPASVLPDPYTFDASDGGNAIFQVRLMDPGNYDVYAFDSDNPSISGSFGITIVPASAASFSISAPSSCKAGEAVYITVTAKDQYNNVAISYTGTASFSSTDSSAILPADASFTPGDMGKKILPVSFRTKGTQTVSAHDLLDASVAGISNATAVLSGALDHFILDAPQAANIGVGFNFAVSASDQYGNAVDDYTGTVQFSTGDPAATLPGSYTFAASDYGSRIFLAYMNTAGTWTISAADSVTPSVDGVTGNISVSNLGNSFSQPLMLTSYITAPSSYQFVYIYVSNPAATAIAPNSYLEYDVFMPLNNADFYTGMEFAGSFGNMRDFGELTQQYLIDQNGIRCHPSMDLGLYAAGSWYHRRIDLSALGNETYNQVELSQDTGNQGLNGAPSNKAGTFNALYDNIKITNSSGTVLRDIFSNANTIPFSGTVSVNGNLPANRGNGGISVPAPLDNYIYIIKGMDVSVNPPAGAVANGISACTVTAHVYAPGNIPVPFALLNFSSDRAEDIVAPVKVSLNTSAITGSNGNGYAVISSTKAGAANITVKSAHFSRIITVNFAPGPPAKVNIIPPVISTLAGGESSARIRIEDANGNFSADPRIITVTSGSATMLFSADNGASWNGFVTVSGSAERNILMRDTLANTVTVHAAAAMLGQGTATVYVNDSPATALSVAASPGTAAAGQSGIAVVQSIDASGNSAYATASVQLSSGNTGMKFSLDNVNFTDCLSFNLSNGRRDIYFRGTVAGTGIDITAASAGLTSGSTSVNIIPAAPAILDGWANKYSVLAGQSVTITAKITDIYGNPIAGKFVTFTAQVQGGSGDSAISPSGNSTDAQGQVTIIFRTKGSPAYGTPPHVSAQNYCIINSIGLLGKTVTIAASEAAVKYSLLPMPLAIGADKKGSFYVNAKDAFGYNAPAPPGHENVFIYVSPPAGANDPDLSLDNGLNWYKYVTATLDSSGSAQVFVKSHYTGSYVLAGVDTQAASPFGPGSTTLNVTTGYYVQVSPSSAAQAYAGSAITVTARIVDQNGNTVGLQGVEMDFSVNNGSIAPLTAYTGVSGKAEAVLYLSIAPGTGHTVSVRMKNPDDIAQSAIITSIPEISFAVSAPASVLRGSAFQAIVRAKDAYGITVPGYTGTAHFTSTDPGAALPADHTFTPADGGVKVFSVIMNTAGVQVISAADTVYGTISGDSNDIYVSNMATPTPTLTGTRTATRTRTATYTVTVSPTLTVSPTITSTPTITPTYTSTYPPQLIDDCNHSLAKNYWGGWWYTYDDIEQGGDSYVSPMSWPYAISHGMTPVVNSFMQGPGYGGTGYAARMTGTVTNTAAYPYIGMGTSLGLDSGFPANIPVDISDCQGISFMAKGNGTQINVKIVPVYANVPTDYNDYKYTFTTTAGWTQYVIPYTSFTQETGWGIIQPLSLVLQNAGSIQFQTFVTFTGYVDLWVDDIVTYGCVPDTPTWTHTPTKTATATPVCSATASPTDIIYTWTVTRTFTITLTPTKTPTPLPGMLDNCEDGDGRNLWNGWWYAFDDYYEGGNSYVVPWSYACGAAHGATGQLFYMQAPGYGGSSHAARMTGYVTVNYTWGYIGMGTQLNQDSGAPAYVPTDLSVYQGVKFRVKGDNKTYAVRIVSGPGMDTGGNFYKFDMLVGSAWTEMTVSFSAFTQDYGYGIEAPLIGVLQNATELQFVTRNQPRASVDLWIDDIEFFGFATPTLTYTCTPTVTCTATQAISATISPTQTLSATGTPPTATSTGSVSHTPTITVTLTATVTPTFNIYLVDDCDSGTEVNLWGGSWYSYDDSDLGGTSFVTPPEAGVFYMQAPGASGAGYCARITGYVTNVYTWGYIGMGTSLHPVPGVLTDAGYCGGLSFLAKGDGKTYTVRLISGPAADTGGNDYKFNFVAPAGWTQVTAPFLSFTQDIGYGNLLPVSQVLKNLTDIKFQTTSQPRLSIDLYVDDLQFSGCAVIPTRTVTPTVTPTPTITVTLTGTRTPRQTRTGTITQTHTVSPTFTNTPTITMTHTITETHTITPTITDTPTITLTHTITPTYTDSFTSTESPTNTATGTSTRTATITVTPSVTNTISMPPPPNMIDNMEDGNMAIIPQQNRIGQWFQYSDGTGWQYMNMEALGYGPSSYALHVTGSGQTVYGAGFGFNFRYTAGGMQPYDVSRHAGIRFYAKADAGSSLALRVMLPNNQTDPAGGLCGTNCYNSFGKDITLSTSWQQFTLPFSAMTQQTGWGMIFPVMNLSQVYQMQFRTNQNTTNRLWIDDIEFYDFPTPTPTMTLTRTLTLTRTVTLTQTLTRTGTPTLTRTPSTTPTVTCTATETFTVTETFTISETHTVSPTFTVTPTITETHTITPTFTITETHTVSPTDTVTPTVTQTHTVTETVTETATFTISPTWTLTETASTTPTITRTHSVSPTATKTPTNTATPTRSATWTVSMTPTRTQTWTITPTITRTGTTTATPTYTCTHTRTMTPSMTPTFTQTFTITETFTISETHTVSPTFTVTPSITETHTITPTFTITDTHSVTPTQTETYTITETSTVTETATATMTCTGTPTYTDTCTVTVTFTATVTFTCTQSVTVTLTQANTWTCTPTLTATRVPIVMPGEVIAYPNPFNPLNGDLRIVFYADYTPETAGLRIYTCSYRLIYDVKWAGVNAGMNLKEVKSYALSMMSAGIYYYYISYLNASGKETRSKLQTLIILK